MNIAALHIHTDRPAVLADFYSQVLNTEPTYANDDIANFDVNNFRLIVMRHSDVSGKNRDAARQMFDFMVNNVDSEFDRIANLGADVVAEPYEFDAGEEHLVIATLADPDGNLFQLISMDMG